MADAKDLLLRFEMDRLNYSKAHRSVPIYGRALLIPAIVFLSFGLVLAIVLIEPLSAQKHIPPEEAADFMGHLANVCGRVSGVRQDPKTINALLLFGDPKNPSFATSIVTLGRNLERKYEGKQVCVVGRIVDEWEPSGFPSITVTDESQIAIE